MKGLQTYLLPVLLPLCILIPMHVRAQGGPVYVIEITQEVDLGLSPYVARVFAEAREKNAAAVVLRVNTFGGRVDVATEIKDMVLNSTVPTIAFVDKRAISAGALIALSANKVVMAPGGAIGAATPIYQSGEKASEKMVSYMRSEMRATAEKNGRDPRIAEAMVDENLMLDDSTYKKYGQLLTLTTEEALKLGYCDLESASLDDALKQLGYGNASVVRTEMAWPEHLVRFFTSPVVSSILIMLGLGGLFYGVKTGHLGAVAGVGFSSIVLFFGAQYLVDLASAIEVVMFVVGVILIALEVFVIPGFGIVGVMGLILMVASIFLALIGNFDLVSMNSLEVPLYTLAASFVGLAILAGLMIKYLPGSGAFQRFVLEGADSRPAAPFNQAELLRLVDSQGQAMTTLRPAGTAIFGTDRYDVITDGEYISAGEPVMVVRVEGRKIVVRRAAVHEDQTTA